MLCLGACWSAVAQVETIDGTNVFRLFEHVTVGIQLRGSEAHAHRLAFRC